MAHCLPLFTTHACAFLFGRVFLKRIAVPAFGPSLLFGVGEGAILPIIPLMARDLGASVPVAALVIALIGIGSLLNNIPASVITARWGSARPSWLRGCGVPSAWHCVC